MIDRYFNNEMNDEELASLLRAIAADPAMKAELDLRRLAKAAHHRAQTLAFKENAMQSHPARSNQETGSGGKVRRLWPYAWAIAASVMLLLAAFAWWWTRASSPNAQQLYALHDVPALYPKAAYALVNEGLHHKGITGSQQLDELKTKGLEAYESKEWHAAIGILSDYIAKAKPDEEEMPDEINLMNLYIARAWLEKEDAPKAIETLQKGIEGVVDSVNYGYLKELMQWQLVLAHLKNNDAPQAKRTANLLRNAEYEAIRQQAVILLNELK